MEQKKKQKTTLQKFTMCGGGTPNIGLTIIPFKRKNEEDEELRMPVNIIKISKSINQVFYIYKCRSITE